MEGAHDIARCPAAAELCIGVLEETGHRAVLLDVTAAGIAERLAGGAFGHYASW